MFSSAVRSAESFLSQKARINAIIVSVMAEVNHFSRRTYFSRHRALFNFLAVLKIVEHERGGLPTDFKTCLYKPASHFQISSCPKKPKEWLADQAYLNLLGLADKIPKFANIVDPIFKKEAWRAWIEKERLEEEACPDTEVDSLHRYARCCSQVSHKVVHMLLILDGCITCCYQRLLSTDAWAHNLLFYPRVLCSSNCTLRCVSVIFIIQPHLAGSCMHAYTFLSQTRAIRCQTKYAKSVHVSQLIGDIVGLRA
jgi:hypothetical protein